jgi:hypothetical protein
MTFDLPGLSVAAVGKAMSEGGLGESVTVVNPVSFRQVIGTVTGPGTVRAGDASILIQQDNQIAAAQPQAAPAAN